MIYDVKEIGIDKKMSIIDKLSKDSVYTRISILSNSLFTISLLWLSPSSLTSLLVEGGGYTAKIIAMIFTATIVLAVVDLVVNDILNIRFKSTTYIATYRHLLYSLIGVLYAVQALASASNYYNTNYEGQWVLMLGYIITAIVCAGFSYLCAYRKRKARANNEV